MFRKTFSGCLGAVCAVFAVIVGCGVLAHLNTSGSNANVPEQSNNPAAEIAQRNTPIEPPEMITVPAIQLDMDYSANEVAADQKYGGKIIRAYGAVDSIDKGPLGNIHIVFMNDPIFGGSSLGIDAMMKPGSDDIAARLVKGQRTVVICEKVERTLGIVSLTGCEFDLSTAHRRDDDAQAPPLQSSY